MIQKKKKKNIIDQKEINGGFDDNYFEYQSKGNKNKILSIKEYLNIIKAYLSNITNDHKEEWKIQLEMKINFVTTMKPIKIRDMYIRSKNIAILIGYKTDEIVEELFGSLLQKYQCALENS